MTSSLRLLLMRHAKSAWPDGVADIDRRLNERGRAAAPRMGAYLAAEGLRPDHVLVSPARRTAETWAALAEHLDGIGARSASVLYEAPASRLLDVVRSSPETARCVLLLGHNPGLQDLALHLAGSGSRNPIREMRDNFPTAAVAVLDFAVARWSEVGRSGGRLDRFVTPRGLAAGSLR